MPAGSEKSTFAITQDKTASVFFPVPECKAISTSGDEVTIDHFNWGAETIRNGDCVLFTNMNSLGMQCTRSLGFTPTNFRHRFRSIPP